MDDVDTRASRAFRDRLRALRTRRRLTLTQAAAAAGFTISSLGGWERGDRVPPLDTLVDLARFYGVTVGYLVGGEGDGPAGRPASAEIRTAAVGLVLAARFHPDLVPAARSALATAVQSGVTLWELALDTGRPGLELARLIADSQLRRSALRDELAAARNYTAQVRAAIRSADGAGLADVVAGDDGSARRLATATGAPRPR